MAEQPRQNDAAAGRGAVNRLNLALLDNPKWGWTAGSGIADVLPPHERARRNETKKNFQKARRKRDRPSAASSSAAAALEIMSGNLKNGATDTAAAAVSAAITPTPLRKDSLQHLEAASPFEDSSEKADADAKNNKSPLHFSARMERQEGGDDVLDIYTYHRGREGLEARTNAGDLVADVPATDTNHGTEPPKMTTTVRIRVAIGQTNETTSQRHHPNLDGGDGGERSSVSSMFQETLHWDLQDLDNETPIYIASRVAEEFGLSFCQTMDLAETMQAQLRTHVRDQQGGLAPPWATAGPAGGRACVGHNRKEGLVELYGEVVGMGHQGGISRERPVQRSSVAKERRSSGSSNTGERTNKASAPKVAPKVAPARRTSSAGSNIGNARKATKLVEPIYRDEMRKRLMQRSTQAIQAACVAAEKRIGEITFASNVACHYCKQTKERVARFACGDETHVYCLQHLGSVCGLVPTADMDGNNSSESQRFGLTYPHCPICALTCSCQLCLQKLDGVAGELRSRALTQHCSTVSEAAFDDFFEFAKTYQPPEKKRHWKPRPAEKPRVVPKIPISDFPPEVAEGVELEPGTEIDYAAVYSEKGRHLPAEIDDAAAINLKAHAPDSSPNKLGFIEDGSVDFCNICRKHGNLLCCDFCPRAFHASCIRPTDVDDDSDDPWECPVCIEEKAGLPEDHVDGKKSLTIICAAYARLNDDLSPEDTAALRLLSKIHEMLIRLMDYDFGYMFRRPVDLTMLPDYTAIVKSPMDLGTIAESLINGRYARKSSPLEDVVVAVLNDIELVWQNCFTFNCEGSAVYRMAQVQRRRAVATRIKSLDGLLTEKMKMALRIYRASWDRMRNPGNDGEKQLIVKKKPRQKIDVGKGGNCRGRLVGILDPDTRRVVKIYSTVQAAGLAVELLLPHCKCEWPYIKNDTKSKVRKIIKDSSKSPGVLLFGFRWLYMDDLRSGHVSFPKHPNGSATAVTVGSSAPSAATSERGDDIVRCGVQLDSERSRNPENDLSPITGDFVKEDLVMGRKLVGFSSLQEAFADWELACNASQSAEPPYARTMEIFEQFYLNGDRNVDGTVWRGQLVRSSPDSLGMGAGQQRARTSNAAATSADQFARPSTLAEDENQVDNTMIQEVEMGSKEHNRNGLHVNGISPLVPPPKKARHKEPLTA